MHANGHQGAKQGLLVLSVVAVVGIFFLIHNGAYHRQEAYKANHRSYLDAHGIENVGVEHALVRAASAHQAEANNHDAHTYG